MLLEGESVFEIGPAAQAEAIPPDESQDLVFAGRRLQEIADYRAAIQGWFKALRVGGRLFIVVPHAFLYERLLAMPGRWNPAQRRLYSPASLMSEVEEALEPNSYRVRWLSDDDQGYDYGLSRDTSSCRRRRRSADPRAHRASGLGIGGNAGGQGARHQLRIPA